ncbi:hypothetical protein C5467_17195 [Photorhabdus khanii subsp. guanajuatensis]|uniref:DUF4158 domain-containing protein n=1 Tax=Photorhabdus khanii subsp. guanajuatensis TaxID=2100166 RepID=A0A4V2X6A3_9GAMM|nr:DUF4158 domain-containing protein [Photorhabdus khanii]TDB51275.1 hypothetical protein C5467_17195 [Photorhabdus khanii subsp. guanajuatensis]
MPRRSILSANERANLLAMPENQDDLIRFYTFNESDMALIQQRRESGLCSCCHKPINSIVL